MKILISKARIIDQYAAYNGQIKDILLDNGKIVLLGENLADQSAEVVLQGEGLCVSPGWLDMRTRICDPGFEYKEDIASAAAAAAAGGFTGIIALPQTKPVVQTKDVIHYIRTKSRGLCVDIYPLGAVTTDLKGEELTEMLDMQAAGAVAFSDGDYPVSHAGVLLRAIQYVHPTGALVIQRPEERKLTQYGQMNEGTTSTWLGLKGMPALAEEMMIQRDLELLRYAGGRLHFTCISTARGIDMVRLAKKEGLGVTCDVSINNLVFDDTALKGFNTRFKLNPPLRLPGDCEALWTGLSDGTVDAVVSDHNPQDEESKNLEFDQAEFGSAGLETAFSALVTYNKGLGLDQLVHVLSHQPRKILGLPQPAIVPGEKANITLFQPAREWDYAASKGKSKSKYAAFDGQKLKGRVMAIINNGLLVRN